jgi:hypothetical protein
MLSGGKQSGKDTFADIFCTTCKLEFHLQPHRVSFAKALKDDIMRRLPFIQHEDMWGTGEQKERFVPQINMTARQLMQQYGTDLVGRIWLPVWVHAASVEIIHILCDPGAVVVVTDLRRQIEIDYTKQLSPTLVRIVRLSSSDRSDLHSSEHELDDFPFKHLIINDGTLDEYKTKVIKWIRDWRSINVD